MRACKTCGHTLPLTDFRPEPRVPDGREAHCKPCQRVIDRKYREKYREQRLAYQREYNIKTKAKRRAEREAVRNDPAAVAKRVQQGRDSRQRYPEKAQARNKLQAAVRRGRIDRPAECEECTTAGPVHAHHDDYFKPFSVRWLCVSCHNLVHAFPLGGEDG